MFIFCGMQSSRGANQELHLASCIQDQASSIYRIRQKLIKDLNVHISYYAGFRGKECRQDIHLASCIPHLASSILDHASSIYRIRQRLLSEDFWISGIIAPLRNKVTWPELAEITIAMQSVAMEMAEAAEWRDPRPLGISR